MRISDWSSDVCSSDLVTEREHQVLADVAHGGARQHDRLEHTGQVAANQSDTGAFDRHVGAGSHRNAYMRSRQCWRVVDAVPGHRYALARGLESLDLAMLVLGRDVCLRSDERRVGKECVSTCRSRWCQVHLKK